MSTARINSKITFLVNTHHPSGHALAADETPKFWVFKETDNSPIVSASGMTAVSGFPATYRGFFTPATVPSGWDSGKWYNVLASGKVAGVVSFSTPLTFYLESTSFNDIPVTGSIVNVNIVQVSGVPVNLDIMQRISSGNSAYYCDVKFIKDTSRDEYTAQWYRNSTPLTSGQFSSPTIQVVRRTNGTDLIASTAMSLIGGSLGTLKFDETSNLTVAGEDYIVKLQATIDGQGRIWQKLIGRDV